MAGEFSTLVSTVGFPIAAFLLMYRMANKTIKENTAVLRDLKTQVQQMNNE